MGWMYLYVVLLLFFGPLKINGAQPKQAPSISNIKGRLLTPEEGCGFSKVANTKIIGGQAAKIGAWPWIALLGYKYNASTRFGCGGNLITSRHVLTAAHCVTSNLTIVRLGEHDTTTESDGLHQDLKVEKFFMHRHYDSFDKLNDIAILSLERDVEFTDRIRPICLPIDNPIRTRSFVGTNPFVAGWGSLQENQTSSTVLQQVQVPVHVNGVCEEVFKNDGQEVWEDQFFNGVMCAGDLAGGKDTCQGDSGGPLMLPIHTNGTFPFYQIGIVAYGIGCGRPGMPSVYTNVAHYAGWIKLAIGE